MNLDDISILMHLDRAVQVAETYNFGESAHQLEEAAAIAKARGFLHAFKLLSELADKQDEACRIPIERSDADEKLDEGAIETLRKESEAAPYANSPIKWYPGVPSLFSKVDALIGERQALRDLAAVLSNAVARIGGCGCTHHAPWGCAKATPERVCECACHDYDHTGEEPYGSKWVPQVKEEATALHERLQKTEAALKIARSYVGRGLDPLDARDANADIDAALSSLDGEAPVTSRHADALREIRRFLEDGMSSNRDPLAVIADIVREALAGEGKPRTFVGVDLAAGVDVTAIARELADGKWSIERVPGNTSGDTSGEAKPKPCGCDAHKDER